MKKVILITAAALCFANSEIIPTDHSQCLKPKSTIYSQGPSSTNGPKMTEATYVTNSPDSYSTSQNTVPQTTTTTLAYTSCPLHSNGHNAFIETQIYSNGQQKYITSAPLQVTNHDAAYLGVSRSMNFQGSNSQTLTFGNPNKPLVITTNSILPNVQTANSQNTPQSTSSAPHETTTPQSNTSFSNNNSNQGYSGSSSTSLNTPANKMPESNSLTQTVGQQQAPINSQNTQTSSLQTTSTNSSGPDNILAGNNNSSSGSENTISGSNNTVQGNQNQVQTSSNVVIGNNNVVSNQCPPHIHS